MSERPTLSARLDALADEMRAVADQMMQDSAKYLPMTRHRIRMHAGEMRGASDLARDWSREIQRETGQ